jgi:hypothetical protein
LSTQPDIAVRVEAALRWARPLLRRAGGGEQEPQFATLIELAERYVTEHQGPSLKEFVLAPTDDLGVYHIGPQDAAQRHAAKTSTIGATLDLIVRAIITGSVELPSDVERTCFDKRVTAAINWLASLPDCAPLAALRKALTVTIIGRLEFDRAKRTGIKFTENSHPHGLRILRPQGHANILFTTGDKDEHD